MVSPWLQKHVAILNVATTRLIWYVTLPNILDTTRPLTAVLCWPMYGQHQILPSASTTAPHPTLSRRRIGRYTRPGVRRQPGRLLCQLLDLMRQKRRPTSCSVSSMLQTESSPIHASTIEGCQFRRRELHWLDSDDRVRSRMSVQVYKCLHNMAPGYLSTLCQPVSSVPGRHHLRSARRGKLDFPRVNLATYGGDRRLPTPVPHLGTLYLTVSRTLCKPSNAISRPSYFPHTRISARLRFLTKTR